MATWAAPTQNPVATSASAGSLSTAALTTPAAHSLLVVFVSWNGAGVTCSVSGGAGNTWVAGTKNDNGNLHGQFFWCLNCLNVATTPLATFSGTATNIQIECLVYVPGNLTTQSAVVVFDVQSATGQGTGTTQTSGSFTPTEGDSLFVAATGSATSTTWGAGGGYNSRQNASYGLIEDLINQSLSGTANTAATGTGGSVSYVTNVITFYATGVGTTLSPMPAPQVQAQQGMIVVGTSTASRFSINTDPYGGTGSGQGTTKVGQIYPTGRN